MPDEIKQEQLQAVRDLLDNEPEVRRAPRFSEEDKQKLALAAKAAGLAVVRWTDAYMDCGYHSERYGQPGFVVLIDGLEDLWNPLTDDSDALRLAVTLRLDIKFLDGFKQVCCRRSDDRDNFEMHGLVGYGEGADPWVSAENVRRAIVRAAAEIGANMQS